MQTHPKLSLIEHFQDLPDPRVQGRTDHEQIDVLIIADLAECEGLRSVGVVESVRQVGTEEPTVERRYYLSSLAVDVEQFARAVRGHWGVENSLHWCLDVQVGEDQSRARTGHAA
jgi:predicted transposase YbfD/YdcC